MSRQAIDRPVRSLRRYWRRAWLAACVGLGLAWSPASLAGTATPATGGSAISADTAATGGSGAYTALTGPSYTETANNDLGNGTVILTAPAGFQFDTAANSVTVILTAGSGTASNNINNVAVGGTIATITPTATTITFTITDASQGNTRNTFAWQGIRVRPINGAPLASGNITASGTSGIAGLVSTNNFGTLTEVAGALLRLVVTLPGQSFTAGSGNSGAATTQTAYASFNITRISATDQFYNIVTSYGGTKTLSYSGPSGSPTYTTSVAFTSGQSTTSLATTLTAAETTQITVSDGTTSGPASSSLTVVALAPLALWSMEQASWSGAANEVLDISGNGYHGQAVNGPTTAGLSPARPGDPGTCRYGAFDGSNDYVAAPASFPNLNTSFTITAWIRTTDINSANHQRIFVDDQNNTGGYALSLGDGGAGRIRFFSRSVTPIILDSPAVISSNAWYFVAGVADTVNRVMRIYVFNAAGALLSSASQGYTGTWGTDAGSVSIGGENNASGEGGTSAWHFLGNLDEVGVWSGAVSQAGLVSIMNRTRACSTLDHIRIEHDGAALTCAAETVTVKACANAACSTLYTGSATTTLAPAGWQGGDTITFSGGSTTAQLWHTTAEAVTLNATSTSPTPSNAARCFNGASETCSLAFADSGFVFDVPALTACKTSGNIAFRAVKKSDTSIACVANPAFVNASATVNFRADYSSPASGTQAVSVNGTAVPTGVAGTQGISLAFDANASANITVRYPDAGQMMLSASYTQSVAGGQTLAMSGSDPFVSKPIGLAVYSTATCAAGDATCAAFRKAGENFNLTVKAACWESDGDTDFSDNAATPNFQLANVALSHNLIAPTPGATGGIGVSAFDFLAVDNGVKVISQSISEVGVFTITATPPAYLGETIGVATSPNLGRFHPDHFVISAVTGPPATPRIVNRSDIAACSASTFTYMGEPLQTEFTLRARNTAGMLTQNYKGAFAKLNAGAIASFNFGARSGTTNLTTRLDTSGTPTGSWSSGDAAMSIPLRVSRGSAPDGPFPNLSIGIAPMDSDGVAMQAYDLDVNNDAANDHTGVAQTEVRFGRLKFFNAYGSELLPLPMRYESQYYDSTVSGFKTNTLDSCTTLAGRVGSGNYIFKLGSGPWTSTLTVGSVLAGRGTINLSAPGAGRSVSFDVAANLGTAAATPTTCRAFSASVPGSAPDLAYLRNVCTGTSYDKDPVGNAVFGVHKNASEFIFMREMY